MTASLAFDPGTRRLGSTPSEWPSLSFAAGLGVVDGLRSFTSADVRLKWPNDVLIEGRKVAGMMIESVGDTVVIGIGVNIVATPDAARLEDPARAPTCLAAHMPDDVAAPTADALLDAVSNPLCDWIAIWAEGGAAALRQPWLARAIGVGEPAVARFGGREVHGVFADLDADGALLLQTDAGLVTVHAGDVFPLGDAVHYGGAFPSGDAAR